MTIHIGVKMTNTDCNRSSCIWYMWVAFLKGLSWYRNTKLPSVNTQIDFQIQHTIWANLNLNTELFFLEWI